MAGGNRSWRCGDPTARRLALAHHVDALVEEGRLADYAAAARILGLTRARMTQVMNLLLLPPQLQARVLDGTLSIPERRLRLALRSADWETQRAAVEGETWLLSRGARLVSRVTSRRDAS